MSSYILLKISLLLHIIGIVIMAGTTFADYFTFRQMLKYLRQDAQKAIAVNTATARFSMLMGLGLALLILSGVLMVSVYGHAFTTQVWFRVKMGIVLLILLNGLLIARPSMTKLRKLLPLGENGKEVSALQKRISIFHITQFLLFVLVFVLSVFRFS
ncbi:DUF2269 family protein [Chitinophaga cymbidii]|uniref:DUF2214 domain-containing protein n=1 Tax=Chitinophaga cymbidii TaxID=1096750 RepID=A0A512RLW2_9BACT|nr:DUF2269 family protein [Chitinophaga cymbidii]GEP96687.1 hypothetical protein CCY01nite_29470 [Chitinophaga cymbidii]